MAIRSSQVVTQALSGATSTSVKNSQMTVQVLSGATSPQVRSSQTATQILIGQASPLTALSQAAILLLASPPDPLESSVSGTSSTSGNLTFVNNSTPIGGSSEGSSEISGKLEIKRVQKVPCSVDFLEKNVNYRDDAIDLVLDQFKDSANYIKIVDVISSVMGDYEKLIVDMAQKSLFQNATGEQLTEIGRQLGVARRTDNDEQYRSILALSTLRRSNDGTRDKLFEILAAHSAQDVEFVFTSDSQFDINLFTACISDIHGTTAILDLLPINTYYRIVDVEGTSFGFDDDDQGFGGEENDPVAGNFCSLISTADN